MSVLANKCKDSVQVSVKFVDMGIVLIRGHMQTPLRTISHKEAAGIQKTFKIGGLVCITDL